MKELEEAQNADVTHKFSERSTVELVEKLIKKGKIELIKCVVGRAHYS